MCAYVQEHAYGLEDLLHGDWRDLRHSGASALAANLTGLARRNRRLDSADLSELDWSRSRWTLELSRIAPRYASLVD